MTTKRLILAVIIIAASACDAVAQVPQLWKQKAGAPTIIVPAGTSGYAVEIPSTQLRLRSSDAGAKSLVFGTSEAMTVDRALTWNVGDAARTITLSGSPTLNDWFNQSVKTGSSPTFATVTSTADATINGHLFGRGAFADESNMRAGVGSLAANVSGTSNLAVGPYALSSTVSSTGLVGVGYGAGSYLLNGSTPLTDSDNGVYIGNDTRASADNVSHEIVIGSGGRGIGAGTTVIGTTNSTAFRAWGTPTFGTANSLTLSLTGLTAARTITAPDFDGTLSTLAGSEALTNKTINGNTITTGTGTLTLAASSSLITSGAFASTLTGTATSNNTLPSGTNTLYSTKSGSITSAELATSVSGKTGTGNLVFSTAPVFTNDLSISSDTATNLTASRHSTNTGGPVWFTRKSRGTQASPSAVAVGDVLGTFLFQGYNDSFRSSASFACIADTGYGATGADVPASLAMSTVPDGSGTAVERLRIASDGSIGIGTSIPGALLDVSTAAGSSPTLQQSDGDVAHGMTGLLPTSALLRIKNYSGSGGGAWVIGAGDEANVPGLSLQGAIGVTDPTDTSPAILLNGSKKNTTSEQAMGALETVFQVETGALGSGTKIMTALGNGNIGIGSLSPLGRLETRSTTGPQLVTGYSATQYLSSSTSSGGVTTLAAAGTTPKIDMTATSGVSINAGTPVLRMLSATATLDYASIAASSDADLTITVTGATVGDVVQLGPPSTLEANLAISYYAVTASNTVTIRLRNLNAVGAIDPASKTWRAMITGF